MIPLVLLPFDIDPNVVRPGWTPLIILILLALAMVALFLSMRKQFRKIDTSRAAQQLPTADESVDPGTRPAAGPTS